MIQWDEEEVFSSSDEFFAGLLAEIKQAKKTIDLEVYIFELDRLGNRVLAALKEAAARGLQVRLMVDGVGSPAWNINILKELELNKVNARIYKPYPWVKIGARFFPRMLKFHRLGTWFRRLNRRNHRKSCVIDGKIAWVGSMNIDEKVMRAYVGERAWRETGVRVRGESVEVLNFAFERAWMMAWAGRPRSFHLRKSNLEHMVWFWKKNPLVRLNLSFYLRNLHYQDLLERFHSATQRIWITSAYFIPSGSIISALRTAARTGVDVRILVSQKMDVKMVGWFTTVVLSGLLRAGVRVFEYEPRVLHAKTMIIDHWAVVGSSNLNHRSMIHDLEVDVLVEKVKSLTDLEKYYLRDLDNASEFRLEDWKSGRWFQHILGNIFFFFRYWL